MKIGIMGDIHGNLSALTRVVTYLRGEQCVKILCLGDIVGYGPRPQECVDLVKGYKMPCVLGNHDDWIGSYLRLAGTSDFVRDMIIWTKKQLTAEAVEFLKALPAQESYAGISFVHASMTPDHRYWPYVRDLASLKESFRHQKCKLCFCGHTHRPALGVLYEGENPYFSQFSETVYLEEGCKYLINPGSVGQPRDDDPRAACAIYDSRDQSVRFIRLEYDIERTQREMEAAGLPEPYIARLALGK